MGKLIVIDGLDGCGKATQTKILYNKLREMGKNVYMVAFPCYESKSSQAVKMYLKGELGTDPSQLNPYICSLFYTVDRGIQFVQSVGSIYEQEDAILLCDRYLSANIIHQGSKCETAEEKEKFFDWVYDTEIKKMGLPQEDVTIILSLPVETSQRLMTERYDSQEAMKDIHEADIQYLHKCYDTVDKAVAYLNSQGHNWIKLDCASGDGVKAREEIEKEIWQVVKGII